MTTTERESRCAQCLLNGSGTFPMRGDDCTNPQCVMYLCLYKAHPHWMTPPAPAARTVTP